MTNNLRAAYAFAGVTLNDNDVLSVSELEFLRNATRILRSEENRTIQNYFVWRFLFNRMGILPKRYRTLREQFNRVAQGTTAETARSIVCANYVNGNMGFAVSKVFIGKYFDETARDEVIVG